MLRTFVNCTNVLTKHLHFLIAKGGTETIVHLSITEGLSFRSLERRIYDCKSWNEKFLSKCAMNFYIFTSKLVA